MVSKRNVTQSELKKSLIFLHLHDIHLGENNFLLKKAITMHFHWFETARNRFQYDCVYQGITFQVSNVVRSKSVCYGLRAPQRCILCILSRSYHFIVMIVLGIEMENFWTEPGVWVTT